MAERKPPVRNIFKNPDQIALENIQREFALCKFGGDVVGVELNQIKSIATFGPAEQLKLYGKQALNILLRRQLRNTPVACSIPAVIQAFWDHPSTKVFERSAFSPSQESDTVLNLWRGSPYQGVEGDCTTITSFIHKVICGQDPVTYSYVLSFLAHMLQRPEEKPGVMLILVGEQGTGKGTFLNLLHQIWSRSTLFVQDVDQITGRYNAALENSFLVLFDEALFVGNHKANDKLKSIVTEPWISIEAKYQPARVIASYHRFVAATNHSHVLQADLFDRRNLFIHVSSHHRQDQAYFREVYRCLDDPKAIDAFVFKLKTLDISKFNVRAKPTTALQIAQQLKSLSGFDRYWYELLCTGELWPEGGAIDGGAKGTFVTTKNIVAGYKAFNSNAGRYSPVQAKELLGRLRYLCPLITGSRQCNTRGLNVPTLGVCRAEFNRSTGLNIRWSGDDDVVPHRQDQSQINFSTDEMESAGETRDSPF